MGFIHNVKNCNIPFDDSVYDLPNERSVVTFNINGEPLSIFSNDIWDFTSFIKTTCNTKKIHFNVCDSLQDEDLIKDIKYQLKLIVYGMIFLDVHTKNRISIAGFIQNLNTNIIFLKKYCIYSKIRPSDISITADFHKYLLESIVNVSFFRCKQTLMFYSQLSSISSIYKNLNFYLPEYVISKIKIISEKLPKNVKEKNQTLIIPVNVLSDYLFKSDEILKDYIFYKENINLWISTSLSDINFGGGGDSQKENIIAFNSTLKKYELVDFAKKYKIRNVRYFHYFVRCVQIVALTKILALTGMRYSEAYKLDISCLKIVEINKKIIFVVYGYSTKKSSSAQTCWISALGIEVAVEVAKLIGYSYKSLFPNSNFSYEDGNYPLFPNIMKSESVILNQGIYDIALIGVKRVNEKLEKLGIFKTIDESDYLEAENINPFTDLSDYKVEKNKIWHFNYHQFRRSLVVYACRSGIVKSTSLKKQMKHLTEEMTYYYGNHSNLANNLILDTALIDDFKNESELQMLINFKKDVMDSNNKLFGAEGYRLQNLKDRKILPLFLVDERETKKLIKNGKLSYKKTALGGCSKVDSCDKLGVLTITTCISCSFAIFTNETTHNLLKTKKMLLSQRELFSINDEINSIDRLLVTVFS